MSKRFFLINFAIGLLFASLTCAFWALSNSQTEEPPWPTRISGMSFSPLRLGNDPAEGTFPTTDQISADLDLLSGKVGSFRTYGVGGTLADIPTLAKDRNMTVALGAWLTSNLEANEKEIDTLVRLAKENRNVTMVFVGNETLLRGDLTLEQLCGYLDRIRQEVKVPVSTGEPWHVWDKYPELANHADFVAAHMLPYWEGIDLDHAIAYVKGNHDTLMQKFPGKPIVFAEVGWPSNGRTRKSAVASEANEAIFLRRFLKLAQEQKYIYFLMEAFDQPWKSESEGAVGAYWGVYNVERGQKFAFIEPIERLPQWRGLALASVIIGIITLSFLLRDGANLKRRGKSFLAAIANGAAAAVVWVIYDYADQYLTPMTIIVGIVLALGFLGLTMVLLTEAHEMAEASWFLRRRRPFNQDNEKNEKDAGYLPKVSIHVPAYNEPPAMLKATLDALARLDYPFFEVLVIDNNTVDAAVWEPVEEHCRILGDRFRFFHVAPLAGFKSGALNFALARTASDAEIIAVIDSDYQVSPSWLHDLIPHFSQPKIGFVQAPQDYRDADETLFKAMCYAEYKGFFHIGMVTRNDRNAIIEHGTMTLIRTSVLKEIGGWAEWCITEDAELGLRIFEQGYEGAYTEESYGRGLMPDTFLDYKKQRARWAYGAVQILRKHAGQLLAFSGRPTGLTQGQRYHFLAGWLPWLADGINLFYTLAAIGWSIAIIIDPKHFDPPLAVLAVPPLFLFFFKVLKLAYLYRSRLGASNGQTFAAAVAGLALSHTVAKAVLQGFLTKNKPFFRTPKCENQPALLRAFAHASEETLLALTLWLAACGVLLVQGRDLPSALLWSIVLFIQSLPYLAALLLSITNALPTHRGAVTRIPTLAMR